MALVVDAVTADWVRRIFHWYVMDRLSVAEIIRRLIADPSAPPPAKSSHWSRQAVIKILRNTRYRGLWRYGSTETIWVSSKDYSRQVKHNKPLKEVMVEELRIVSDEIWYKAAQLLAKEAAKVVGRKPRDGDRSKRPRMLNGLFVCATHNRPLYVGGPHGQVMFCKDCQAIPATERPLFSLLPRKLALEKTCSAVSELIQKQIDLIPRIIIACQRYAAEQQTPDPKLLQNLTSRRAKLDQRIGFVMRNPGETEADQAESSTELRRLRKEREESEAELAGYESARSRIIVVPTEVEVRNMLMELSSILASATADDQQREGLVRELIELVTGGSIELTQVGEQRAKFGWLRGRFRASIFATITLRLTGIPISENASIGDDIVIDYRRDPNKIPADLIQKIIHAYENGQLLKHIAKSLGLPRNLVAQILDDWYKRQGIVRADGRSRRTQLTVKHLDTPLYQKIADEVKAMADTGCLLGEIADKLNLDRNTVTSAWNFWHKSRNLPVPDGRTRRKSLDRKSRESRSIID